MSTRSQSRRPGAAAIARGLGACAGAGALLLSACGSGSGGVPRGLCEPIGGGGASVTSVCNGCTFSDAAAVADGDLQSAAGLDWAGNADGSIRGTAQAGLVFTGGVRAGVAIQRPVVPPGDSLEISIGTYQGGALVQRGVAYSSASRSCPGCSGMGDFVFVAVEAPGQFDAIEMSFSRTGEAGPGMRLHEFCIGPPGAADDGGPA